MSLSHIAIEILLLSSINGSLLYNKYIKQRNKTSQMDFLSLSLSVFLFSPVVDSYRSRMHVRMRYMPSLSSLINIIRMQLLLLLRTTTRLSDFLFFLLLLSIDFFYSFLIIYRSRRVFSQSRQSMMTVNDCTMHRI